MSSPNGETPFILYDLMRVADFRFLLKPLRVGKYRRVHFNNVVEVFNVISRAEIIEHNLKPMLWWNTTDYESFKTDAHTEILFYTIEHPGVDFYTARRILCNPDYKDVLETINE